MKYTMEDAKREHEDVRNMIRNRKIVVKQYEKELKLIPDNCNQVINTITLEINRLNHEIKELTARSKRISELKHRLRRVGEIPYDEALKQIIWK